MDCGPVDYASSDTPRPPGRASGRHRRLLAATVLVWLCVFGYVLGPVVLPANNPFAVYGRVVDEAGRPVPGVRVTGSVVYDRNRVSLPIPHSGPLASLPVDVRTDDRGGFAISGRGTSLALDYFAKDGYGQPARMPYFTFYSRVPQSTLANPVVIVLPLDQSGTTTSPTRVRNAGLSRSGLRRQTDPLPGRPAG